MIGFVITIHVIACLLLIIIILIQSGRGGGLVESFSGVESMFGPKTNSFLTRATTILSILFFITCLSLALLSAKQSRSLMRDKKIQTKESPKEETQKETVAAKETVASSANQQEKEDQTGLTSDAASQNPKELTQTDTEEESNKE